MELSNELISSFVSATKDAGNRKEKTLFTGTVVEPMDDEDGIIVAIDGGYRASVETTVEIQYDDIVVVSIENHRGLIIGNKTNPTAKPIDSDSAWEMLKEKVQDAVDESAQSIDDRINNLIAGLGDKLSYIYIDDSGEKPYLVLGTTTGVFRTYITDNGIDFMDGDTVKTHIGTDGLDVDDITITNNFKMTNYDESTTDSNIKKSSFVWKIRANGNCGLEWEDVG